MYQWHADAQALPVRRTFCSPRYFTNVVFAIVLKIVFTPVDSLSSPSRGRTTQRAQSHSSRITSPFANVSFTMNRLRPVPPSRARHPSRQTSAIFCLVHPPLLHFDVWDRQGFRDVVWIHGPSHGKQHGQFTFTPHTRRWPSVAWLRHFLRNSIPMLCADFSPPQHQIELKQMHPEPCGSVLSGSEHTW